jgi:hypothetical protein
MKDKILTLLTLAFIGIVLASSIKLAFFPKPIDKQIEETEERIILQFSDTEARILETEYDMKEIMATLDSIDCKLNELAAKRMN